MNQDMSDYQVRPATVSDAKTIGEIHVCTWQEAYKGILPDDYLSALSAEKRQAFWREAIKLGEPQVLVATEGKEVVGFAAFDRSRDKGTPPTTGEIWAIYVDPSYWDSGVGLALWDAVRDGLQDEGCTQVTIWLPLRGQRALRFHELAGFKRELPSAKTVDIGGVKVEEIRLHRAVA